MKSAIITFLLSLTLFFTHAATAENAIEVADSTGGITLSLLNRHENDALTKRITLVPANNFTITVTDVPQDIWFIVLQIHIHGDTVIMLAYEEEALHVNSTRSLYGTNIGLYLKTHNVTDPIQVYVLVNNNRHNVEIDGLLAIVPYGRNAPIPGGCNMEFNVEIAPYQKLQYNKNVNSVTRMHNSPMITVTMQPASALAANGSTLSCEKQLVQYKVYQVYLPSQDFTPDTYLKAIANMLTPQNIVQNGNEMPSSAYMTSMQHFYNPHIGVGSIYAAVATYGNYSSAYVPTFTYACDPMGCPESCRVLNIKIFKVCCILSMIIGLYSVVRGYKCAVIDFLLVPQTSFFFYWFSFEPAIFINFKTLMIIFIIILLFTTFSYFAMKPTFTWKTFLSLIYNVAIGFLCANIIYLYAPVGWFHFLEKDMLCILLITCITAIMAKLLILLFMINPSIASAIRCSAGGSFCVIIATDYLMDGNLKYIFITMIRRIYNFHMSSAYMYPPFERTDQVLVVLWFVLMGIRLTAQFCHNKKNNEEEAPLLPA